MKRLRTIAAAPQRTAGEAWGAIAALVVDTVVRSPAIARADAEAALDKAAGVGRMLTAGGHLERSPIVLVAGDLYLDITTVSGADALALDENLNPVPGAAAAEDWTLHLPQCAPLAKLVREAAKGDAHLSADEATEPAAKSAASINGGLDEAALARWAQETR